MTPITYARLFEYLVRLGFEDLSTSAFERVFEHTEQGILLAFSMLDDETVDRPVRGADITSVEVKLRQQGLLSGALADAEQQISEG